MSEPPAPPSAAPGSVITEPEQAIASAVNGIHTSIPTPRRAMTSRVASDVPRDCFHRHETLAAVRSVHRHKLAHQRLPRRVNLQVS